MSALQFLNKKSWHTATIKNNEKVWLKEQAAEKEKKRMEELQKQLAEERRLQEIQRLEEQSGRIDPAELLKRRRLNWMYEHGSDKNGAKQKEKDREDTLLGRKEIELETPEQDVRHTSFAEEEAKMREDPLVQIQLERARILRLAGRDPSKRIDPEREAKRKRKEERARIREERKVRRERRAKRQSSRPQSLSVNKGREYERYGRHSREGTADANADAKTSHERKMDELRALEQKLLADMREGHLEPDKERTTVRKRPRSDSSHEKQDSSDGYTHHNRGSNDDSGGRYGLSLPGSGSGVAVTREFVPSSKRRVMERRREDTREEYRWSSRYRSVSPDRRGRRGARRTVTSEERKRRVAEMRRDADRMDVERRDRLERYATEEREERKYMHSRDDQPQSFARDYISAGVSRGSMAGRIRQRRAWATRDDDAAY